MYCVSADRWRDAYRDNIRAIGGEILASAADGPGLSLLASAPGDIKVERLNAQLAAAGANDVRISEVGSHAAINRLASAVTAENSHG